MKLLNSTTLLEGALTKGYALPALNTNGGTYDIARAILEAANELRSPIIIQAYGPNLEYRGYDYFALLVKHLAEDIDVPVCLSLDHGASLDAVMRAVKAGFTHIMFDYAHHPIEENIAYTNKVIDLVRPLNIGVEAEIGEILINQGDDARAPLTPIADIKAFCSQVDVDFLAVGVGTTHGIFERQDTIDFEHIKMAKQACGVPLVLHGTCGLSMEDVSKAVKCGMTKVNFGEGLRMEYINYFKEFESTLNHQHHPWRIMRAAKDKLKNYAKDLIMAVGSDGKV